MRRSQWQYLLQGATSACSSHVARPSSDDLHKRAERAAALVALGELSADAQSLTAEPWAPLKEATLTELRERQLQEQHSLLREEDLSFTSEHAFQLDGERSVGNLRGGRRGAAAGPSGGTLEHYRILLDDEYPTDLVITAAGFFVEGGDPSRCSCRLALGKDGRATKS